jgi:hypothetical protein
MTNDLRHWINCRTTQSMEQGLTGRFANNEVVALGNYTVHSKHKRVSGTGQASSLAGSRCASRVYLADSCRLLQRGISDALTPICSAPMLGQTFFPPFPTILSIFLPTSLPTIAAFASCHSLSRPSLVFHSLREPRTLITLL